VQQHSVRVRTFASTKDIIRQIWEAQGYGNLAVWDDGTTQVVDPGQTPFREVSTSRYLQTPPPCGGFPTLDHAQYNGELRTSLRKGYEPPGER